MTPSEDIYILSSSPWLSTPECNVTGLRDLREKKRKLDKATGGRSATTARISRPRKPMPLHILLESPHRSVRLMDTVIWAIRFLVLDGANGGNNYREQGNQGSEVQLGPAAMSMRICFPSSLQLNSVSLVRRPDKYADAKQRVNPGYYPEGGCRNGSSVPPLQRCWPDGALVVEVAGDGIRIDPSSDKSVPTNTIFYLQNVTLLCEHSVSMTCLTEQQVEPLVCYQETKRQFENDTTSFLDDYRPDLQQPDNSRGRRRHRAVVVGAAVAAFHGIGLQVHFTSRLMVADQSVFSAATDDDNHLHWHSTTLYRRLYTCGVVHECGRALKAMTTQHHPGYRTSGPPELSAGSRGDYSNLPLCNIQNGRPHSTLLWRTTTSSSGQSLIAPAFGSTTFSSGKHVVTQNASPSPLHGQPLPHLGQVSLAAAVLQTPDQEATMISARAILTRFCVRSLFLDNLALLDSPYYLAAFLHQNYVHPHTGQKGINPAELGTPNAHSAGSPHSCATSGCSQLSHTVACPAIVPASSNVNEAAKRYIIASQFQPLRGVILDMDNFVYEVARLILPYTLRSELPVASASVD
ncbi:hypothetical protein VOLCADRAFT_86291 [Volvox carteri f. nagariensis]|uniref:Uncharacterized protein n=1 Tax=Volvox carteri f. nagariensis TaxID=3068 RepID=D8TIE1_VOLCA|nr:uncharacterized protein VOLCADRAFT_86291 [Volvox carteri f. nagariensis]EFJ52874.1 hypothetical protein VOLCADRAFT_86291 [Volvox carteri f. nagariensis]|eukprot:XP_002945879.1 hypothetical protein VOLCADRAFT_86291 [Volvox carteri f. nagariensis]